MQRILKAIELWASESDDRVRLLVILIWVAFGVFVLLSILVTALIMLPPDYKLF
jgi:phage shock protein PspC (stress-responsive transcriptional regulator)